MGEVVRALSIAGWVWTPLFFAGAWVWWRYRRTARGFRVIVDDSPSDSNG